MRFRRGTDEVTKAGALPRVLRTMTVIGSISALSVAGRAQNPPDWKQQVNQTIGTNGKLQNGVLSWNLIRMDLGFNLTLGSTGQQAGFTLTQGTAETPVTGTASTGAVGGVNFSPSTLTVSAGQTATAQISSGVNMTAYPPLVSSNSNPGVASASINGFNLVISGKSAGSTNVIVCLTGGVTCANMPVTVTAATDGSSGGTSSSGTAASGRTSVSGTAGSVGGVQFNPSTLTVNVGQTATSQISSGVNMTAYPPYVSSNSNPGIASASINGFNLVVSGKSAGSTDVVVCLTGGVTCSTIPVTVTAATGSTGGATTGSTTASTMTGTFALQPAMASGLLTFKMSETGQVLMTVEFPVREPEVDTFVSVLEANGARTTAVHNHYSQDQPRIVFVHAEGLGDPVKLAQAVQAAWSSIGAPVDADGESDSDDKADLNPNDVNNIIHGSANALDGVVEVTVNRNDNILDVFGNNALSLPSEMGPQSEFEFQPLNNTQSVVIGEFCLRANEVEPVLQLLRGAGFSVSALHNHFLFDDPHLFFLHISAAGATTDLATTIRKALDLTNSSK